MGSQQSKKSNLSTYEYANHNPNGNINSSNVSMKNNRSSSSQHLNRATSSPIMACIKPQFNFRDLDSNSNGNRNKNSNNNYNGSNRNTNHQNGLNHHVHGKQNSSNLNSSKSSISTNTHSTPSPRTPIKHNQLYAEPRRIQPQPVSHRPPVNGQQQQQQQQQPPVTKRSQNRNGQIAQLSNQMRTNQQKLNNIIKESDSNRPSYHLSSKLYKPKSLIAANQNQISPPGNKILKKYSTIELKNSKLSLYFYDIAIPEAHLRVQTLPHKNKALKQHQQHHPQQQLNVNTNLPPKKFCKSSDQLHSPTNKNVQISPNNPQYKSTNHLNDQTIGSPNRIRRLQTTHYYEEKIPVTSKIKRKLIETISNKVSNANLHKSSVSS